MKVLEYSTGFGQLFAPIPRDVQNLGSAVKRLLSVEDQDLAVALFFTDDDGNSVEAGVSTRIEVHEVRGDSYELATSATDIWTSALSGSTTYTWEANSGTAPVAVGGASSLQAVLNSVATGRSVTQQQNEQITSLVIDQATGEIYTSVAKSVAELHVDLVHIATFSAEEKAKWE